MTYCDTENIDQLIQRLWSTMNTSMWHAMSCRCCGGGMFSMNAKVLEADLLDYLADKYQSQGLEPVCDALTQRKNNPTLGLPAWLLELDTEGSVPAFMMMQLKCDIAQMLKSLQGDQKY